MTQTNAAQTSDTFHLDAFRPSWPAIKRGMARKCPQCGAKTMFAGYTRIADQCSVCGQDFTGQRADDAPPYITMMIVGHVLAIPMVETVRNFDVPLGIQLAVWLSVALAMTFWLLPVTKGGLVGLQWAQRMHGFGEEPGALYEDVPPQGAIREDAG